MKATSYSLILLVFFKFVRCKKMTGGISITLQSLDYCNGYALKKDYINLDTLKIWPNYTSSGHVEIVQDIPTDAAGRFQISLENNGKWARSALSINNINFCEFIEHDLWFAPLIRIVFPNFPERCPVKKADYAFKTVTACKRTRGIMPFGCFKGEFTISRNKNALSCVKIITNLAEFSERFDRDCTKIAD